MRRCRGRTVSLPRFLPTAVEGREQLGAHGGKNCALGRLPDHDRGPGPRREEAFVRPVEFPQQPLGAVSGDGASARFPAEMPTWRFPHQGSRGTPYNASCARASPSAPPRGTPVGAQAFARGKLRGRSGGNGHFLPLTVTERRLRPLARRREMTFRPPGSTSARGSRGFFSAAGCAAGTCASWESRSFHQHDSLK